MHIWRQLEHPLFFSRVVTVVNIRRCADLTPVLPGTHTHTLPPPCPHPRAIYIQFSRCQLYPASGQAHVSHDPAARHYNVCHTVDHRLL